MYKLPTRRSLYHSGIEQFSVGPFFLRISSNVPELIHPTYLPTNCTCLLLNILTFVFRYVSVRCSNIKCLIQCLYLENNVKAKSLLDIVMHQSVHFFQ